jgi:hypothetical protein
MRITQAAWRAREPGSIETEKWAPVLQDFAAEWGDHRFWASLDLRSLRSTANEAGAAGED